jgi:hypothetical protein
MEALPVKKKIKNVSEECSGMLQNETGYRKNS